MGYTVWLVVSTEIEHLKLHGDNAVTKRDGTQDNQERVQFSSY